MDGRHTAKARADNEDIAFDGFLTAGGYILRELMDLRVGAVGYACCLRSHWHFAAQERLGFDICHVELVNEFPG